MGLERLGVRLAHEVADPLRIHRLVRRERGGRDAAEALYPRRVDQVLLGRLAGNSAGPRVEDVLMNRIGDEPAALIRVGDALHHGEGITRSPRITRSPSSLRIKELGPDRRRVLT